jgi:DNA-binding FadR family transcriptional regulator
MNGFDEIINGLIAETEKTIMNLSNIEGSESVQSLLKEVQDAIKSNDIEKLNQIMEQHGDKTNK